MYYLDIDDVEWQRNIEKRNRDVLRGQTKDYYVDQGLLDKLNRMFEVPCREEMDVWVPIEFQNKI